MTATSEPRVAHGAGSMREIVMGAQGNLTNVLAVVLGVAIGTGDVRTVALAGLAAGIAEAISMGGVLYTSTRAERDLALREGGGASSERAGLRFVAIGGLAALGSALVGALLKVDAA